MAETIDLSSFRQAREAAPLARATNSFLALATQTNHAGLDTKLLLQAMTIALAKLVAEATDHDDAERVARQIGESLPALVEHLIRNDPPH
ncbi:hypothetical protein [Skermanella stibiiresistens]|nr:hypothetical protein [Skermanella stibiiresistens]